MTAGNPRRTLTLAVFAAALGIGSCPTARSPELPSLPVLTEVQLKEVEPAVKGQIQEALTTTRSDPRNAQANGRLGMILQAYELYQTSVPCYRRARLLDPTSFAWVYYLATAQAAASADSTIIVALLQEALRLNPDYLPARLKLAEALLAMGRFEESRRTCDFLLEKNPNSARVQYLAGRVKSAMGETSAAVENYYRACELAPRYGSAHYALGLAYRQLGETAKAEEQLSLYRENQARVPPVDDPLVDKLESLKVGAYYHLSEGRRLHDDGQLQQALREYQLALDTKPRLLQAHVNLISIYGALGSLPEAQKHYQAALEIDPRNADASYNYGLALSEQKRFEEAEGAFRKSLELDPSSADAHNNLGYTLERQQRIREAEASYRRAITAQPNHREAHFNLARLLEKRGRFLEAIGHLQETLSTEDGRTPVFMYYLSAAYLQVGNNERALYYAQHARWRAESQGQTKLAGMAGELLQQVRQTTQER